MPQATEDELVGLATRCEQATGPDRELDALIRCAVFAPQGAFVRRSPVNGAWCTYEIGYGGKERLWEPRGLSQEARVGAFTASLDAAMALAVEGISAPDVLRHAITQCSRYGAPTFIEALPRFVAAQWLLARASTKEQQP
jgi:hypothetical protein